MARQDDQTEALMRDMLDLYEQERKLVAYEIHDGLSQLLVCTLYKFQLAERLRDDDLAAAKKACDEGVELLHEAIDETRRLISGLRPPVLDESGIVAAIQLLVDEHRQSEGLDIEFTHDGEMDRLAGPIETALFRIAQECLTNACRYSQSDRVCVTFRAKGGRVMLDVRDWGIGFDLSQVPSGHFGLRGVQERAHLLGGSVIIQTAPGRGTHVLVDLPWIPQNDDSTTWCGRAKDADHSSFARFDAL